jgi:drug/metabolite transporter (DMT)-like permease
MSKPQTNSDELSDHSERSPPWLGRLLIVVAAILWSTSGFFAKAPIFEDWPIEGRGLLLAFWRAFFATLILATMVRKIQWSWKLIPLVLFFALMNWTFLTAIVKCESTLAIWLQYTAPAWVFLASWRFFKDEPTKRDWLLLAFAAAGISVILIAESGGANPIGVLFGLASGFFFAGVVVMLRWLKEYDAAWLVFLNHAATTIVFLPFVFAPIFLNQEVTPSTEQLLYLAGFGMFQMGLPYLLFARAVQSVPSHEASGLALLESLLVPVWVFVAWRNAPDYEYPAVTTIIGASLIFAGLVIRYWPRRTLVEK